jgi:hypothetical protein
MDLLVFWICAIYGLGYCAVFMVMFPIVEAKWTGGTQTNWRSFWPALLLTTVLSLWWPVTTVHFYLKGNPRATS